MSGTNLAGATGAGDIRFGSGLSIDEQIERGLAKYGSTDNWPTLRLLPEQFPFCECGKPRLVHADQGRGRLGKCEQFRARGVRP